MTPAIAALLADLLLVLHAGVVLFVVLGELLVLAGGWRGWGWVRIRWLRLLHLLLMAFIALQAWLGQLCPLTGWEQALRARAGESTYEGAFVAHWLGELLYVEAPWWAFIAAYSGFALLVAASWRLVPPAPRGAAWRHRGAGNRRL